MKPFIAALLLLVSFGASAHANWKVNEAVMLEYTAKVSAEYYVIGYWAASEGACKSEKKSRQLAEEAFTAVKYNAKPDDLYFAAIHFALLELGMCGD